MGKKNRPACLLARQLHIFCEGEKTEPNYLRYYRDVICGMTRNSTYRDRVIIENRGKNSPVELVEEAIEKKKSYPPHHKVWVVYDREAQHKYPDTLHNDARQKAEANAIGVALSNVCFEVWLLLHFQETASAYTSCEDLLRRSDLKKHFSRYDKSGDFSSITEGQIVKARKRAKAINKATEKGADPNHTQPHQWNPYTDVYKLLDEIDQFLLQEASR